MNLLKTTIGALGGLLIVVVCLLVLAQNKGYQLSASVFESQNYKPYASCIRSFTNEDPSAFKITEVSLNSDGKADALVQYTNKDQCGSGGCIFELCLSNNTGSAEHIPFGLTARSIDVLQTVTNSMHDLEINKDDHLIMSWNGKEYNLNQN